MQNRYTEINRNKKYIGHKQETEKIGRVKMHKTNALADSGAYQRQGSVPKSGKHVRK